MPSEECSCGRVGIHCPKCGSRDKYVYAKKIFIIQGAKIHVYRCRGCGDDYDDLLLSRTCGAPKIIPKVKFGWVRENNDIEKPESVTEEEMKNRIAQAKERLRSK
jgi:transposase-like protein